MSYTAAYCKFPCVSRVSHKAIYTQQVAPWRASTAIYKRLTLYREEATECVYGGRHDKGNHGYLTSAKRLSGSKLVGWT